MSALCVSRRRRRLRTRSASAPERKERKSMGPDWSAPITPSLNGEWVSSRTIQACPTLCIQLPTSETSCPVQKRRKSRYRKARSAVGQTIDYTVPRMLGLPRARSPWIAVGVLAGALVLAAAPAPLPSARAPGAYLTGQLLIATDDLQAPRFIRTALFMLRHDATGPLRPVLTP